MEHRQCVHYNVVKDDVWHITPIVLDKNYWESYGMAFLAFEHLVSELTPFWSLPKIMLDHPFPFATKLFKLVIFGLAYGVSCKVMDKMYGCGESTIRKHMSVICAVLTNCDR